MQVRPKALVGLPFWILLKGKVELCRRSLHHNSSSNIAVGGSVAARPAAIDMQCARDSSGVGSNEQ
jgi:hypothetical protein